MITANYFGRTLSRLRKEKAATEPLYSDEHWARAVGISPWDMQAIENGSVEPSVQQIRMILELLPELASELAEPQPETLPNPPSIEVEKQEDLPDPVEESLRDDFAMASLVGFLASDAFAPSEGVELARRSYEVADAMMRERARRSLR